MADCCTTADLCRIQMNLAHHCNSSHPHGMHVRGGVSIALAYLQRLFSLQSLEGGRQQCHTLQSSALRHEDCIQTAAQGLCGT
jgi:hypothetical protein